MPISTAAAAQLRKKAALLSGRINDLNFALSEVIWHTHKDTINGKKVVIDDKVIPPMPIPVWLHWGYDDWGKYVEEELQISFERAIDYVQIWECFGIKLKGKWKKKNLLPMSKMRLLIDVVDAGNVDAWLERAKTINEAELRAITTGMRRGQGIQLLTRLSFILEVGRANTVRAIFDIVKPILGVRTQSDALYKIMQFVLNNLALFKKQMGVP